MRLRWDAVGLAAAKTGLHFWLWCSIGGILGGNQKYTGDHQFAQVREQIAADELDYTVPE